MPRLSFTLRDVFWVTLVVGIGVGWWVRERQVTAAAAREAAELKEQIAASEAAHGKTRIEQKMLEHQVTLYGFTVSKDPKLGPVIYRMERSATPD